MMMLRSDADLTARRGDVLQSDTHPPRAFNALVNIPGSSHPKIRNVVTHVSVVSL